MIGMHLVYCVFEYWSHAITGFRKRKYIENLSTILLMEIHFLLNSYFLSLSLSRYNWIPSLVPFHPNVATLECSVDHRNLNSYTRARRINAWKCRKYSPIYGLYGMCIRLKIRDALKIEILCNFIIEVKINEWRMQ